VITVNEPFVLKARENGSSGYTWIVDMEACDELSYESQVKAEQASANSQRKAGMVGMPTVRYISISVGAA